MREVALTTVDNPFDPFDQFVEWYQYDTLHCRDASGNVIRPDCCTRLARSAITSDALSEQEDNDELEDTIDDIVLTDPLGVFTKAVRDN